MTLCAGSLALVARPPAVAGLTDAGSDYPIRPVPPAQVEITDAFWAGKLEVNRTVSIQHVFDRSEARGGRAPAQLIEAAAYMLSKRPDPALEKRVDYRTGEIGPPEAMFLSRDIDWREFGLIVWRVK